MQYEKPLPKINADNGPFWEGCHQHEIRFQQCSDCGHIRWPPANLCPRCHSVQTKRMVSKGIGKIYTYAVYHSAFHQGFASELPYTVAVVALDEGPHLLTNIVGCQPGEVQCDMPVEVSWEDINEEITLPKFKPCGQVTGENNV